MKKPRAVEKEPATITGLWDVPVTVQRNHFIHKSLSSFSCNIGVGCQHGCTFCYVTDTSTSKLRKQLLTYGVHDAVGDWGQYSFLRPWDEQKFITSLAIAELVPENELNADGNRAVFFCSTTDPYAVVREADPGKQKTLQRHAAFLMRRSLELIRDHSTLNVRILTRSPRALQDLDIFQSFGSRLLLGTSLPTLDNRLSRAYEPYAPAPTQRLKMLHQAREAGVNVFAAVAPAFPEAGEAGLRETFAALAEIKPVTVFFEPINIRLGNVARMERVAARLGVRLETGVYASPAAWRAYALGTLRTAERIARETDLAGQLHLWPDPALGCRSALAEQSDPAAYLEWLQRCWAKISAWP